MQISMKRSLRIKFVVLFSVLILDIFAVVLFIRYFYTLPQLQQLEQKSDNKDIHRITSLIQSKIDELALVNYDNAVWNDSYNFIETKNQGFIDDNFVIDTFRSLDINGLYFYDNDGDLVWGQTVTRDTFEVINDPNFQQNKTWLAQGLLVSPTEVIDNNNKPVTHKGIIFIDQKPIMFAATSIMPSAGKGNSRGSLVFFRKILPRNELAFIKSAAFNMQFIWPNHPQYQNILLKRSTKRDIINKRDEANWITIEGKSLFNETPYFIKFQASQRLYDPELINIPIVIALFMALIGIVYVFIYVNWNIVSPVILWRNMMQQVIKRNEYSLRLASSLQDELGDLAEGFNQVMKHVEEQDSQIKEQNSRLIELSNTDGLTKVNNRRFFDTFLHEAWKKNTQKTICLCLCDIDYFKPYNDNYGHQAGDRALITIADTLLANSKRASDIVARYGGEEFAVILDNTSLEAGIHAAQNLCRAIESLNLPHENSPFKKVTMSVGVASIIPTAANSPRTLIHDADRALYEAKSKGRNQVISHQG